MKYTAHAKRLKTDTFHLLEPGAQSYGGAVGKALKWVEKETLLDPKLWAVFVEQFRIGDVDDADLGWRSEYWGKMMRGACFTYRCTFDEELYRTMEFTVKDILTTIDRYGRVSGYSVVREFHGWDMWGRKYVLLGLQYFLEICRDDALADRIVESMCRQADYIINKVGAGEVGKIDVTYTSEWWDGLNSSSILEPFVRLYNITGRPEYLDFAKKIIDCGGMRGFNIFEAALKGELCPYQYPVTKAYEMISCFEGIIEYYRVTCEEKYLRMAVNFARLVCESDITVIGSAGTTHELFDNSRARQFNPEFKGIMQETCVTVTWMKFCLQLLSITGDSKYADLMETSAYNALLGAVNYNRNPYQGEIFAFDSYSPLLNSTRGLAVGGYKPLLGGAMHWGCCVAIGAC
ncbi:MAG: glycoside hydrolase family 127 protein, partial [Clostridia bacterium]|nr:glycoside hydrolase family 127 protein [Clostridia bacterium]